jgi:hypothetical protein
MPAEPLVQPAMMDTALLQQMVNHAVQVQTQVQHGAPPQAALQPDIMPPQSTVKGRRYYFLQNSVYVVVVLSVKFCFL